MAKQEQIRKRSKRTAGARVAEGATDVTNADLARKTDETLEGIDEVLDAQLDEELLSAMDEVLGTEEEARKFVAAYVQQGGE